MNESKSTKGGIALREAKTIVALLHKVFQSMSDLSFLLGPLCGIEPPSLSSGSFRVVAEFLDIALFVPLK